MAGSREASRITIWLIRSRGCVIFTRGLRITSRVEKGANERLRSIPLLWGWLLALRCGPQGLAISMSVRKSMGSMGGNETSSMVGHAGVVLDGDDVCAG